jgi:hypothetical protein
MENEMKKIPSPFKAPDGYFEDFENRLSEKMKQSNVSEPLRVQRGGLSIMEYAAVAATLAILMVTGWFMFFKNQNRPLETVAATHAPAQIDTIVSPEKVEAPEEVITATSIAVSLYEDVQYAATYESGRDKNTLSTSDETAAVQLEEAGLIVMDTDDGLFDSFEL